VGKFNSKRTLASGISVAAVAAALCITAPAHAQTFSTIRGENASPGSTVTAINTNTGERSTATVGPDGIFVMVGIRPGNYRLEGAGEATNVDVPVGQTVTVDAAPAVAETGEGAIVVTGRRDRQEVRTATVTTNVTPYQIENLPQNDRNFLNFAQLAPGVQVAPSGGDKSVQAGAVSGDRINVFIDGLSLKNPVNHGGVAGQNFSQGNPFPQLAVQEFKVDTQNFKAEYENSGSAIITAVTKTGGTDFHGDAFIQYQPKQWIKKPYFDRGNGNPKPDYKRYQYGVDVGGPIIKEKLHFFAAFEGTKTTLPATNINLDPARVPANIVSEFNGSAAQDFEQQLYFGKLTAFVTENDTVDLSTFIRKEQNLRDFGGIDVPTHGHDITSDGKLFQLEWKHRGDNWLNEFTLAYNTFENGTPRVSDGSEIVLTCTPFASPGPGLPPPPGCDPDPTRATGDNRVANLGTHPFAQNDRQKTFTFKNNTTFEVGDHIVKGGIKITRSKYERLEDNLSNGAYFFQSLPFTSFEGSIPYLARVSTVDVQPASAKNTQIGLFIQDDWTPDEHWTINAGIRWDYETNAKNEDFVTPANVAAALRAYEGWQAAGIDPEDYISDGDNRKPYKWAIQPRLGVSYDVYGNRDLVFFAGAGRYYDRPLFITAGIETIKNYYESVSTLRFCGAAGLEACPGTPVAGVIQWNDSFRDVENLRAAAIAQGLGGSIWLLNNDTKLPYSDQFNVGIRKRFGDWNTSVTFSHIRSHNIFQFVRGNRMPDGSYPTTSVTGEFVIRDDFPPEGDLPGFNGKLNIGANDGKANYNAIFLQADKPYSRASGWGVTSTLTIQRARSNVGTEIKADEFFAGPDQTQFGWQYVQGVPKWMLVTTGIVGLPWDFTLSGTLNMTSGPAFGSVIFYPDGGVANLGGVYYPKKDIAYKTLDVRVAKTFKTPWGHELTADFQVYNLFDWVNRNYSAWGAGSGVNPPLKENGTVGTARAFQAGLKYSF
jgi:outer membrane receptor protein involved in Fe transport